MAYPAQRSEGNEPEDSGCDEEEERGSDTALGQLSETGQEEASDSSDDVS